MNDREKKIPSGVRRLLLPALVVTMTSAPAAFAGLVDFESFTAGQSVNGQGQWTVEDSFGNSAEQFDEGVVDLGGNQVWRMSNAVTSGSYSNQPFSNKPDQVAGETGAGLYNDYGIDHTSPNNPPLSSATAASPFFHASWDFKSATDGPQADLFIAISAGASQSPLRQSWISIADSGGGGFDVGFYDTAGSSFNPTTLTTGLSYDEWHTIEMYIEFVDGIGPGAAGSETGNDIVTIFIDGVQVHVGTTWESYFYNVADGGISAPSARAVDSLLFRASGTAAPGTAGGGLYFDNVLVDNASLNAASVAEPATAVMAALGMLGFAASRRRA